MGLFEGERIKIFPNTNIVQYGRWIQLQGFDYKREGNYLVVLKSRYSPKYDKNKFALILKHRRKLKGITREELAEKIGVTEYTVFTWEIARYMPCDYNLEKIIAVLDITKEELNKCQN